VASNAERAAEFLTARKGEVEGVGEWFEIDQERINAFADVTIDHQFIHVDPERAKDTPFGSTIAHGFLTLSMLTHLTSSIERDMAPYEGIVMGVNYGFDKVRFPAPVKVGARIRARSEFGDVVLKDPNTLQVTRNMTVEIEGEQRPGCVAEWVTLLVYA